MRIRMIFLAAAVTVRLLSGAAGLSLSENNLFRGFDGMVPGETRTQEIEFINESRDDAVFRLSAGSASGFGMIVAGGGKTLRDISRIPYVLTDPDRGQTVRSGKLSEAIPEFRLCRLAPGEKKRYLLEISLPASFGNEWEGTGIENSWVIECETYGHGDSGSGDGSSTGSIVPEQAAGSDVLNSLPDTEEAEKTGTEETGKTGAEKTGTERTETGETEREGIEVGETGQGETWTGETAAEETGIEEIEPEETELLEEGEEEGDMACCCFWWHLIEVIELAVVIVLTFLIYKNMKEKKEDQEGLQE